MSFNHLLAGLLALLALTPASAAAPKAAPPVLIVATAQGAHVVGRANARLKLVEYVSYTCSHCAHFEEEGAPALMQTVVQSGKGSIEYRPLLRNVIDLAATLMAGCGAPAKFTGNHAALLLSQQKWLIPPSEAQQERWRTGDFATRLRAVAADMYLYPIFEGRGYSRAELDACLANESLANKIAAENRQAMAELKLEGTPSFLINGKLQPAHDWATLRPAVMAALR